MKRNTTHIRRENWLKGAALIVAFLLSATPSQAQQCSFHSDCGPGKLCDNGSCRDVESVLSRTGRVFWVAQNQSSASDNNPGTKTQPWKTISRAAGRGVLRPGDAVIVRQGTYRETVKPWVGGQRGKRITFAAYPGDNVVVSGANPLNSGWQRDGNAWKHTRIKALYSPKYEDRGFIHYGKVPFRRELVAVNGRALKPVASRGELRPGTFYVEGGTRSPRALYMRLPGDKSPQGQNIEVAERGEGFAPQGTDCNGRGGPLGHYALIGFTFRHYGSHPQNAAVCLGGEGSLFEGNTVEWSNSGGFKMSGKSHVMRDNQANNNGMTGVTGTCNDCLLEYSETSGNNWKDFPTAWEAGGVKFTKSSKITIRNHLAKDNNGAGVWFDHNNTENVVERSVFINNMSAGINLEFNTTRTVVRNNVVYGTRFQWWRGDGIRASASSNNIIVYNTVIQNEGAGIRLKGTDRRARSGNNVVYNNLFIKNATTQEQQQYEMHIEDVDVATAKSNRLDGNLYWRHNDGEKGTTFYFKNYPQRQQGFRSNDDLRLWREVTGGARNSRLIDASKPLTKNMSSAEGWRLVENSQARGMSVRLPAGTAEVINDIDAGRRPASGADVGADQFGSGGGGQTAPSPSPTPSPSDDSELAIRSLGKVNPDGKTFFGTLQVEISTSTGGATIFYTLDGKSPDQNAKRYTGPITLDKITTVRARAYKDGEAVSAIEAKEFRAKVSMTKITARKTGSKAEITISTPTPGAEIYYTLDGSIPGKGKKRYTRPFQVGGSMTLKTAAFKSGLQWSNAVTKNINVASLSVGETTVIADGELQEDFVVDAAPSKGAVVFSWNEADAGATFTVERGLEGAGASKASEASFESVATAGAVDLSEGQARYRLDFQEANLTPGPQTLRLKRTTAEGDVSYSEAVEVVVELPNDYDLSSAYPNPFNPSTQFEIVVKEAQEVRAEVYDMLGRRVAVLHEGPMAANQRQQLRFDAGTLASGNYVLRVQGEHFTATQTMTLVK